MEKKKKGTWGGPRPGSGRKSLGDNAIKAPLSFRVKPATLRRVRALREATRQDDMPFNRMFEQWVEDMAKDYGIE